MSRPKQKSLLAKAHGPRGFGPARASALSCGGGNARDIEDLRRHALVGFDKIPGT